MTHCAEHARPLEWIGSLCGWLLRHLSLLRRVAGFCVVVTSGSDFGTTLPLVKNIGSLVNLRHG